MKFHFSSGLTPLTVSRVLRTLRLVGADAPPVSRVLRTLRLVGADAPPVSRVLRTLRLLVLMGGGWWG